MSDTSADLAKHTVNLDDAGFCGVISLWNSNWLVKPTHELFHALSEDPRRWIGQGILHGAVDQPEYSPPVDPPGDPPLPVAMGRRDGKVGCLPAVG